METNHGWKQIKKNEFTKVFFDSLGSQFHITNFKGDILASIPSSGRDYKFNKKLACLFSSGFEDAFYAGDASDEAKMMCYVCSYCPTCSVGKPHSKDCLITIENEEYFESSEIAV